MITANEVIEMQRIGYDSKYIEKVKYIESRIVSASSKGSESLFLSKNEDCFSGSRDGNNNLLKKIKESGFSAYVYLEDGSHWHWWEKDCRGVEISWRGMKK